ncbi:gamma-glutamyl-gamma-aminobutyrate hydrolase family protein [Gulosibacter faecalis]|uniref:Gamma-glutamyl-gamma-aminobutyrate hydrolase family protein n=1 Tax=Gulosibacter faecalis TaxID=272240 RepID=A0ABW5UTT4_9MICO|nr:gamma-glutamyl-gamma-aminobutyrate hydrolase family protein [Gulosibacter faecalis]
MTGRPVIAIPALSSAKVKGLRFSASVVANGVIEAVRRAGGDPVLLPPLLDWSDPASRIMRHVDGIVLPGGPDVDPKRYGQRAEDRYAGCDFAGQDEADARAIELASQLRLPALLICRAMQLWNVERGGDLVQHWPQEPRNHVDTVHDVVVVRDSRLAGALGDTADLDAVSVSSYHHQAIGRLGRGLRVVARADDGAVEAIEDESLEIVAVQWHPEDRADRVASDLALFQWVVNAAGRAA